MFLLLVKKIESWCLYIKYPAVLPLGTFLLVVLLSSQRFFGRFIFIIILLVRSILREHIGHYLHGLFNACC